jgi:hypothetical protein
MATIIEVRKSKVSNEKERVEYLIIIMNPASVICLTLINVSIHDMFPACFS